MITAKERNTMNAYLNRTQKDFIAFMEIDKLPKLHRKIIDIKLDNIKSYGAFAQVFYDVEKDEFRLDIWKDIYKPQLHAEYILFHEYAHVYDIEKYAKADKKKYASIKGYIEYHGAQVELLRQLGAKRVDSNICFSMNDIIKGVEYKSDSVFNIIKKKKKVAENLMSSQSFPESIEDLVIITGMIFNHLGRVSICKMYADDYADFKDELESYDVETSFFGYEIWKQITSFMSGFMSDEAIEVEMRNYLDVFKSIIKKYNLL